MKHKNNNHESERYMAYGVSAAKADVHDAVSSIEHGIIENAFCKVVEDVFSKDPHYCVISHADGAGTKSILAYLHYTLYKDPTVFKGIAQDAIVMNLDDLLCVGATQGFAVSTIINRNAKRIDGHIIRAVIEGSQEFVERLNALGITSTLCGGETADVGDIVKTILVDSVVTTRIRREKLIKNVIKAGETIISLSSGGEPCVYEETANSGIGSNGLTAARHELLGRQVGQNYKEVFDDALQPELVYKGSYALDDKLPGTEMTVLDALLSPTRTFAPVIKIILESEHLAKHVSGLVHCSGGGQTKCIRFGQRIHYFKDLGEEILPIFRETKRVSGMSWREMSMIFNLGYRMEIYCSKEVVHEILSIVDSFKINARVVGHTEPSSYEGNRLTLKVEGEEHEFMAPKKE